MREAHLGGISNHFEGLCDVVQSLEGDHLRAMPSSVALRHTGDLQDVRGCRQRDGLLACRVRADGSL